MKLPKVLVFLRQVLICQDLQTQMYILTLNRVYKIKFVQIVYLLLKILIIKIVLVQIVQLARRLHQPK